MKGKKTPPATVAAAPAAADPAARETWTMRVLKPGIVDQVDFEADPTAAGAAFGGGWKMTSMPGGSGAPPPAPERAEGRRRAARQGRPRH